MILIYYVQMEEVALSDHCKYKPARLTMNATGSKTIVTRTSVSIIIHAPGQSTPYLNTVCLDLIRASCLSLWPFALASEDIQRQFCGHQTSISTHLHCSGKIASKVRDVVCYQCLIAFSSEHKRTSCMLRLLDGQSGLLKLDPTMSDASPS